MKILPENKKKTLWLTIVFLASAGGIVYVNFFMGADTTTTVLTNSEIRNTVSSPSDSESFQSPGAPSTPSSPTIPSNGEDGESVTKAPVIRSQGGLLPYGTSIDTTITTVPSFRALSQPPEFTLNQEELGKDNPFQP